MRRKTKENLKAIGIILGFGFAILVAAIATLGIPLSIIYFVWKYFNG